MATAIESFVTMTEPPVVLFTNRSRRLVGKFRCCAYAPAHKQKYVAGRLDATWVRVAAMIVKVSFSPI